MQLNNQKLYKQALIFLIKGVKSDIVKFHLIKQKDFNGVCIYCKNKIKGKFRHITDPGSRLHYVLRKCNHCGREERIKVSFSSSGLTHSELEKKIA